MSTSDYAVSEWLLSSVFSFTSSIFPEAKPFTYFSSVFTVLPSNVFQCLLGLLCSFCAFENILHNLWGLVLAVVESSLPTKVRKQWCAEDSPSVFIYFYGSSTMQLVREISLAGRCLLDSSTATSKSKAWRHNIFSLVLSLCFLHTHTRACTSCWNSYFSWYICKKDESSLSWDYSFPHMHRPLCVANDATRCPICINAYRNNFLCFPPRVPVWEEQR